MQGRKFVRTGGLILAAATVGYLIGPPIAQAAVGLTIIRDSRTAAKARVTAGNLWVNATGSLIFTVPNGETVLVSGSASALSTNSRTAPSRGSVSTSRLREARRSRSPFARAESRVQEPSSGRGRSRQPVIWTTLSQDIFLPTITAGGFNAVVTNAGGATVQYEIYGFGFGVNFAVPRAGPRPGRNAGAGPAWCCRPRRLAPAGKPES